MGMYESSSMLRQQAVQGGAAATVAMYNPVVPCASATQDIAARVPVPVHLVGRVQGCDTACFLGAA